MRCKETLPGSTTVSSLNKKGNGELFPLRTILISITSFILEHDFDSVCVCVCERKIKKERVRLYVSASVSMPVFPIDKDLKDSHTSKTAEVFQTLD